MPELPVPSDVLDAHRRWLQERLATLLNGVEAAKDGMRGLAYG